MDFEPALRSGRLIRRYKRFLADVELDGGEIVTAHCANPGSMLSLLETPGQPAWLSLSDNPKRKLPWTLELLEVGGTLVSVNTQHANKLAEEAIRAGLVPALAGYDSIRREVRYGENSRIDLLLSREGGPDCYVEVKAVTLSRAPGLVEFPDSVTKRGTKHLHELRKLADNGGKAALFLLSPRADGTCFRPAADIDPAWADALTQAVNAGVTVICHTCTVTPGGLYATGQIDVQLD